MEGRRPGLFRALLALERKARQQFKPGPGHHGQFNSTLTIRLLAATQLQSTANEVQNSAKHQVTEISGPFRSRQEPRSNFSLSFSLFSTITATE